MKRDNCVNLARGKNFLSLGKFLIGNQCILFDRPKGCCFFTQLAVDFSTEHGVVYYHFAHWVNAWKTSGQPSYRINGLNYRVENVIKQLVHESADINSSADIKSTDEFKKVFFEYFSQ